MHEHRGEGQPGRGLLRLPAGRPVPLPRALAAAAATLALVSAAGPLRDTDVWWRVRLGDLVLSTRRVPTREPWNFPVLGRRLTPTGWLGDVTLALAHRLGGWNGVAAWRLLFGALLLVLLARLVPPRTLGTATVYGVTALALAPFLVERPQLLSLCLLAGLLPYVLADRVRPDAAFGLGWVWAMLHGLWVLLPAVLLLRAAGSPRRWRLLLCAVASVAGAAVTPLGPRLLAQPFAYAHAARDLVEWQPVAPWSSTALPVLLLAAVPAIAWLRARSLPVAEALWVAAAVAATLAAARNLGPALLLLAPVAARYVRMPDVRRSLPFPAAAALGAVGAALVVAVAAGTPTFVHGTPVRLVAALRAEPGEVRVLNEYGTGGLVTGLGGPRVHAAVDGRLDAYPDGFVHRYVEAMRGHGDWAAVVDSLRPTHALLARRGVVATSLERDRGWRRLGEEGPYVLLAAP